MGYVALFVIVLGLRLLNKLKVILNLTQRPKIDCGAVSSFAPLSVRQAGGIDVADEILDYKSRLLPTDPGFQVIY
ncbi:hypothetical protein K457DRAFT_139633 [Linnemannia elongata AG-77]|uniref:Uncharacterized protein n=1 Tax=Linnemannia elongata AG-77 TaxID=1314771 RepID=A0A197JQ37_9FUNG|nr:hypothetical protein K457DRAFT_139633 [Linnemannia elongata AG-77]